MIRVLLRKQRMEWTRLLFRDGKTGGPMKPAAMMGFACLYGLSFVSVCAMVVLLAGSLCGPLVEAGVGWLYHCLWALMAVAAGTVCSMLSTYNALYGPRDNEFLLSLPIPVRDLLLVRLLGVWAFGLLVAGAVLVPAFAVYQVTVGWDLPALAAELALLGVLSLLILSLACALGWVTAKLRRRVRHKSLVALFLAAAFIVGYYALMFRFYGAVQSLLLHAGALGEALRGSAAPLYALGLAGMGHWPSLLWWTLPVLALTGLLWWVLRRSFWTLAAANGESAAARRSSGIRDRSVSGALLLRELRRLFASPVYLLNCAMFSLFLLLLAGFALVKGSWLREMVQAMLPGQEPLLALLACAVLSMGASANDLTAPSISLEGTQLWILRSLPVTAWQVLRAKLHLHLAVTLPPVLLAGLALLPVVQPGPVMAVLLVLAPCVLTLLMAAWGLLWNLKLPNLQWTNETVPIKQGAPVPLSLFGGWILVAALAGGYWLLRDLVSPTGYLLAATVALALLSALLLQWLRTRGCELFEGL